MIVFYIAMILQCVTLLCTQVSSDGEVKGVKFRNEDDQILYVVLTFAETREEELLPHDGQIKSNRSRE